MNGREASAVSGTWLTGIVAVMLVFHGASFADTAPANAAHGAQLVATCVSCHGAGGEGDADLGFPRLAGQSPSYLVGQMQDFQAHTRVRPVMAAPVKGLAVTDLADIAAYYHGLNGAPVYPRRPQLPVPERGHVLVMQGDAALGIAPCASCHGATLAGRFPDVPYLAGQNAEYVREQIQAWKSGDRHSDRGAVMVDIARHVSAADADAIAQWLAAQPPPHP